MNSEVDSKVHEALLELISYQEEYGDTISVRVASSDNVDDIYIGNKDYGILLDRQGGIVFVGG